ncbi:hypothetical protein DMC30DRAFT_413470 [Rhodotorula diobovata]|uniref:Zn(2)-C6 fungal-type domain-containing protein n=1 Tax=Rhodotorula diobovata TaxID=5288 RepID=A0A5C5G537_9BASI|nr:hypothetical protein DMC30DRAFT_413470 [Rhodotorula diobovata]
MEGFAGDASAPPPHPVYTPYTFSTAPPLPSSYPPTAPSFPAYHHATVPPPPSHAVPHRQGSGTDESMLPSPSSSRRTSATDVHGVSVVPTTLHQGAWTGDDPDMLAEEGAPPPKIIQKADRSCKKCRERRVRCGREFPTCARCKKRRDACQFGEGVHIEETVEGSDQQRIADLEGKITLLQTQLRTASTTAVRPAPVLVSSGPPTALGRASLAVDISRALTDILTPADSTVVATFLAEESQAGGKPSNFGSVDFRLAAGGLAHAVTCHLLDTAIRACDSKLPALASIASRVPLFKANLHDLEPHDQVNVATLCALGARTSSDSSLFGVASVSSPEGTPVPALFATVGSRREALCRTLEKRARETAWASGLFRTATGESAEAVAALTMLSLHEENNPEETRWFVRQAVGLFLDLRHSEMLQGTRSTLGKTVGLAIFLADAQLAVRCGRPTVISPLELQDYWATSGLSIPDLVNARLPEMVDSMLATTMTYEDVGTLIETIFFYVFACYRVFAQVTSPARRTGSSSVLSFVRNLWNLVDQLHNAIQRLQQHLVSLSDPFPGSEGDPHAVDHAILLAVLGDDILVHLVGYIHMYLLRDRSSGMYGPEREGDEDLVRARGESSMRVFKCLKLFAFYCQLYCGSQDKHNVFHLLMQLAPLGNWTELVALRIGQPGGPMSDEFEVSEEEVEWFRMALELSLFYSPRLGPALQAVVAARQKHLYKAPPPVYQSQPSPSFAPTVPAMPHLSAQQDPSLTSPVPSNGSLHYPYSPRMSFDVATATSNGAHLGLSAPVTTFSPTSPSSAPLSFPFVHPHRSADPSRTQTPQQQPTPTGSGNGNGLQGLHTQEGFADGAADDLAGTTAGSDVRSAFRSVAWADLSLTPAPVMGSDESADSAEDWTRGGVPRGAK